jgi:hypothetical protein
MNNLNNSIDKSALHLYNDLDEMRRKYFNVNFEAAIHKLRIRTYNAIEAATRNLSMSDRVRFILDRDTKYSRFRNIGTRAIEEIFDFREQLWNELKTISSENNQLSNQKKQKEEKLSFVTLFDSLTEEKAKEYDQFLAIEYKSLLPETVKKLEEIISTRFLVDKIRFILKDDVDFERLMNHDERATNDLLSFRKTITNELITLMNQNDETPDLAIHRKKIENIDKISNYQLNSNELINEQGKINLFKFINEMLKNGLVYNELRTEIFYLHFREGIFDYSEPFLTSINRDQAKTKIIRNTIFSSFEKSFSFVKTIEPDALDLSMFDTQKSFFVLDNHTSKNINNQSAVHFTPFFHATIFSYLFKDQFYVLKHDISNPAAYPYKHFYFLKIDRFSPFNETAFLGDFRELLNEKQRKNMLIVHLDSYLRKFFLNKNLNDETIFQDIYNFCLFFMKEEFNLIPDEFGNLIFERTALYNINECILDILTQKNSPLTKQEIYNQLQSRQLKETLTEEKLEKFLNKKENNLFYWKKNDSYSTIEWAQKNGLLLMNGNITDMIYAYLLDTNQPAKKMDIFAEIIRYQNCTYSKFVDNINQNLDKFTLLPDDLVDIKH